MDFFDHLREATGDAHRALEDELDLLRPPLSRERFAAVIAGFLGFHAVWEPALQRDSAFSDILVGRSRLECARSDLIALGLTREAVAALPLCAEAARPTRTFGGVVGSLYVMEGSTLGGKVITRALAQAPWLPVSGLTYFDPYGDATGEMWRRFKQQARQLRPEPAWSEVEAGALDTFNILRRWLTRGAPDHTALEGATA